MIIDNPSKNKTTDSSVKKEVLTLARNSLYSFLNSYGTFIFSIITFFFMARLISDVEWGYLILANTYILIILLILSFLPPGLGPSLNYYFPRYIVQNDLNQLKSHIKYAIYIKILFIIPVFFISMFVFVSFTDLFAITLQSHTNILLILSPIIIITGLDSILISINKGLNQFKTVFVLLLVRYAFNIGALIFCIFVLNTVDLEVIAIINVLSLLFPFLLNCLVVLIKYKRIKDNNQKQFSIKTQLRNTIKYGTNIKLGQFFSEIWAQIQPLSIGTFSSPNFVTGFTIARNYSLFSSSMTISFVSPLTISFSRFNVKQKHEQIENLYNVFLIYSLFLLLLITGILYFCTDIFLVFVYGQSYLDFSLLLKIMLFTIVFLGIGTPYESFMLAIGKSKWVFRYRLLAFLIRLPFFLCFLLNFDLVWALLSIVISNLIIAGIASILSIKIGGIRLNLKKLLLMLASFFLALIIAIIFDNIFLYEFNLFILQSINLSSLNHLNLWTIGLFLLAFFLFVFFTKVFSVKDLEYLEGLLSKETKTQTLLKKGLKILRRIIRD
ncbi:MAG: lipopolysaccharide biosynthesis protein [Promethearchaeota archaeon]